MSGLKFETCINCKKNIRIALNWHSLVIVCVVSFPSAKSLPHFSCSTYLQSLAVTILTAMPISRSMQSDHDLSFDEAPGDVLGRLTSLHGDGVNYNRLITAGRWLILFDIPAVFHSEWWSMNDREIWEGVILSALYWRFPHAAFFTAMCWWRSSGKSWQVTSSMTEIPLSIGQCLSQFDWHRDWPGKPTAWRQRCRQWRKIPIIVFVYTYIDNHTHTHIYIYIYIYIYINVYVYIYTHTHTRTSSICISSTFERYPMDPSEWIYGQICWAGSFLWQAALVLPGGPGAWNIWGQCDFGHRIKVILGCLRCLHSIQWHTTWYR